MFVPQIQNWYKNSPFFLTHQIFRQKNAFFLYFASQTWHFWHFRCLKTRFLGFWRVFSLYFK